MIRTQGSSTHFTYKYEDTLNGAQQRAAALQGSCEADLATLETLFGESGGFDGGNAVTVEVNSLAGLGQNNGYKTGGATKITVVPWSTVTPAATADAGARLEFVAEMAEVLMDLRNQRKGSTSWNPGGSNGEGLSQVCAARLYQAAYYDAQLQHGPDRVTRWLNDSTRPDWVTRTEGTDKNFTSFGCAALFIYFLVSQRGFSLHDVITKAGADLEATYRNLTGQGGGWNEFKGLLDRFFPTGHTYSPPSCDLFPLYDDNRRGVSFSFASKPLRSPSFLPAGKVRVAPCVFAPPSEYSYDWVEPHSDLVCTASLEGFGNPVVTWLVDGIALPDSGGRVTVTGEVDVDQPEHPFKPVVTSQSFALDAGAQQDVSTYQGHAVAVTLSPVGHPGHERLTIEARVKERYATVPTFDAYTWETLETRFVYYEPPFESDRKACLERWRDFVKRHVRFRHINILLTLPDPPPDVIAIARGLDRMRVELIELASEEPAVAVQVVATIARTLRLPAESIVAGIPALEALERG